MKINFNEAVNALLFKQIISEIIYKTGRDIEKGNNNVVIVRHS